VGLFYNNRQNVYEPEAGFNRTIFYCNDRAC